jgi:hypothetical protein
VRAALARHGINGEPALVRAVLALVKAHATRTKRAVPMARLPQLLAAARLSVGDAA